MGLSELFSPHDQLSLLDFKVLLTASAAEAPEMCTWPLSTGIPLGTLI